MRGMRDDKICDMGDTREIRAIRDIRDVRDVRDIRTACHPATGAS